jgi:hypothetical protein
MRKLGITVVGLLAGLVVGVMLNEVVISATVSDPSELADSPPLALLVGFMPPGLAILGAVTARLIDRRRRRHERSV